MKSIATLLLGLALALPVEAGSRNGVRFDPGRDMTGRAEGAPVELDHVTGFLGQWDVVITRPGDEGESLEASGVAEITFMNRGHGLLENFYSPDVGGHELAAMRFLGFNPASKRWYLGGADSWAERAWVADGAFDGEALEFRDSRRLLGGITLTEFRIRFEQPSAHRLRVSVESSTDRGATFTPVEERLYSRRETRSELLEPESEYGAPAPGRPAGAEGFDFLIGEWTETHNMTFPNGQKAQWRANGTAVHALNGTAVMEFGWFDVDPSLPDAATTILRVYNRNMRRWESLYVANRGHSILYFGGAKDADRIVLHSFEADASTPISRWVFHGIEKDSYHWYGETSTDRGETFNTTWTIDGVRKKVDGPG